MYTTTKHAVSIDDVHLNITIYGDITKSHETYLLIVRTCACPKNNIETTPSRTNRIRRSCYLHLCSTMLGTIIHVLRCYLGLRRTVQSTLISTGRKLYVMITRMPPCIPNTFVPITMPDLLIYQLLSTQYGPHPHNPYEPFPKRVLGTSNKSPLESTSKHSHHPQLHWNEHCTVE